MYPPVSPIIFQIGSFSLHWYGVIIVVAIAIGAWVASRYLTRHGQDGSQVWNMLLWVLIPALIGERLYYVFIQSPRGPDGLGEYLANPILILEIWNGGLHIYGAFIFGGAALALYVWKHKLPLLPYFDAVALGLLIGQAIGRWANFINQELYGPPTTLPWGLRIDTNPNHRISPYDDLTKYPDSTRFQPLFLYESLGNFIGLGLIFWISRRFEKKLRPGDVFLLYLIWYPSLRFCLEFFRTDSWFFPGTPFNVVHLLSFVAVISAIVLLFLRHRPGRVPALQGIGGTGPVETAEDENEDIVGAGLAPALVHPENGLEVEQAETIESDTVETIDAESANAGVTSAASDSA